MGVGQRALSLRSHGGGPPPPPGPGGDGVTTPYSWSIGGTTVTSLLRGSGGFDHPRESLNPSLHTGGPRRGHSFRRRLRRWSRWHGSRSVEMMSYVVVTARLLRHEGASATPRGFGYGDTSSFGLLQPGTGPYGRLACPRTLTSPLLRQHATLYVHYSFTFWGLLPQQTAAAGIYACAYKPWRQAWRLRGARRHLWRQIRLLHNPVDVALGDTRPGPRLNFFFSAWIADRRITYANLLQRSRHRHCHQSSSSIIIIVAEQHRSRRRHRPSPVQAEHLSFSFMW